MKTYQRIALALDARKADMALAERAKEMVARAMKDAPSGSGIDCGTHISASSTSKQLVFTANYHHMTENGYYDGWTYYTIVVRPSLKYTIEITISGRDRNNVKDYLWDVYFNWLTSEFVD